METKLKTWRRISVIDILYQLSPDQAVEINGKTYPTANILDANDTSGLALVTKYLFVTKKQYQVIRTANEGFHVVITPRTSQNSYKESYWTCIFEKEGLPSFVIDIPEKTIVFLVTQSAVNQGVIPEPVEFAYYDKTLGLLHHDMKSLKELMQDKEEAATFSPSATRDWKIGYSYKIKRDENVMIGEFREIAKICKVTPTKQNHFAEYAIRLDFNTKNKVVAYSLIDDPNDSFERLVRRAFDWTLQKSKCPARPICRKIFDPGQPSTYYQQIAEIITAALTGKGQQMNCSILEYLKIIRQATALYDYDPHATIRILQQPPTWYIPPWKPPQNFPYMELIHNGVKNTYPVTDCMRHIATAVHNSINQSPINP